MGALVGLFLLAACGTAPQPLHHPASSRPDASSVATSPATPSPAFDVRVLATGAAPSPTGTMAFAVLANESATADGAVTVDIVLSALSSNGHEPVQVPAQISEIDAGSQQAVVTPISIPNGDEVASVTADISDLHAVATNPGQLHAGTPAYVADPISPTAAVKVSASASLNADVTVICWSSSGAVVGGGEKDVTVPAGGETVSVALALQDTPDHCTGYARPS
jgi:hypothetical protein